jgi:quinol monooxygenase YgiN
VIVVVVESTVMPGQSARALQSAQDALRRAASAHSAGRQARLFQSRIDPSRFLYLGVWTSRTSFDAIFHARQHTEFERSLIEPPQPRYFRIVSAFERMLMPMEIVVCQMVSAPSTTGPQLRACFDAFHARRHEAGPGLILSMVCEEFDEPGNFVLVSGWQSAEALALGVAVYGGDFERSLAAAGASCQRFLGQTRYDSQQSRSASVSELV